MALDEIETNLMPSLSYLFANVNGNGSMSMFWSGVALPARSWELAFDSFWVEEEVERECDDLPLLTFSVYLICFSRASGGPRDTLFTQNAGFFIFFFCFCSWLGDSNRVDKTFPTVIHLEPELMWCVGEGTSTNSRLIISKRQNDDGLWWNMLMTYACEHHVDRNLS